MRLQMQFCLLNSLLLVGVVDSWSLTIRSEAKLPYQRISSTFQNHPRYRRRTALRSAQTYDMYGQNTDPNYPYDYDNEYDMSQHPEQEEETQFALTPAEVQQLTQAIYEFNDQVQRYYDARLEVLRDILRQIQELHYYYNEPETMINRLYELQSTIDAYIVEAEENLQLQTIEMEAHGPHLDDLSNYSKRNKSIRRLQVQAKHSQRKLKKAVPAKYYQNVISMIRPNPAPGMPITASESIYGSLKISQPALMAQLQSIVSTINPNQATVLTMKKNGPVLAAQVESTATSLSKKIALAQPLLLAQWESALEGWELALEQTLQNQAILTDELFQLMVDAKSLISCYLVDLGGTVADASGSCDNIL